MLASEPAEQNDAAAKEPDALAGADLIVPPQQDEEPLLEDVLIISADKCLVEGLGDDEVESDRKSDVKKDKDREKVTFLSS